MSKPSKGVRPGKIVVQIGDIALPLTYPKDPVVYEGQEWWIKVDFEPVARLVELYLAGKRGDEPPPELTPELQAFIAGRRARG